MFSRAAKLAAGVVALTACAARAAVLVDFQVAQPPPLPKDVKQCTVQILQYVSIFVLRPRGSRFYTRLTFSGSRIGGLSATPSERTSLHGNVCVCEMLLRRSTLGPR